MNGNEKEQQLPPNEPDDTPPEPSKELSNMPKNTETEATYHEEGAPDTLEENDNAIESEESSATIDDATIQDETKETATEDGTIEEATVEHINEEMPFTEAPTDKTVEEITEPPNQQVPEEPLKQTQEEAQEEAKEEVQTEPVIEFNFLETDSRWLLKVIAGPNSGAEFSLHGGSAYIIGTDATQCDIIFHDMSISRKHAKITIDANENASIEDVDSKNGIFIDGQQITSYQVKGNVMVTLGTTTFVLIDRTQDQKTIFAPKTIAKEPPPLQGRVPSTATTKEAPVEMPEKQMEPIREAASLSIHTEVEKIKEESQEGKKGKLKKIIRISSIIVLVVLILIAVGIGATSLFQTETVKTEAINNPQEIITQDLKLFPGVRFSYNTSNKHLLLVGHVLTAEDQTRMLDMIQQLPFISELNSSGVVIDEFVWSEINQILAKNPAWRSITITSPEAGKFVLSGFLKTRAMNEELLNYLSQNFAYMNLLDQKVVIEEDLLSKIRQDLASAGCQGVKPSISNGELILTGAVSFDKKEEFEHLLEQFRSLAGIRAVQSQVIQSGESQAIVDVTGKYTITGYSQQKGNVSVVVNGRIVGRGDILDGMLIVDITSTTIFLEHGGVTYKIDYIK